MGIALYVISTLGNRCGNCIICNIQPYRWRWTFNDHLKKHCKECGIKYRSSHKIRFYTASVTYDGKNTRELSRQMGHSQVSTTIGYLRDVNQTEDLTSLFSRLGKNAYKA